MQPIIEQRANAIVALKVLRGEMKRENLPVMVEQMIQQVPEKVLRDVSLGRTSELLELKPLPKPKPEPKPKPVAKKTTKKTKESDNAK